MTARGFPKNFAKCDKKLHGVTTQQTIKNVFLESGVPREVLGCSNVTPRNSEGIPKSCQTKPDCENLKIAEFRMPTPKDVWKKGSRILKLPMFAIVLH